MLLTTPRTRNVPIAWKKFPVNKRREIRSGKWLGTENRPAERDRRERRPVVVVAAGAVPTDVKSRLPIEVDAPERDSGPQMRQWGSAMVSVLPSSTVSSSAAASISGSTACQVTPSSEVHSGGDGHIADPGASGAAGHACENHCPDKDIRIRA